MHAARLSGVGTWVLIVDKLVFLNGVSAVGGLGPSAKPYEWLKRQKKEDDSFSDIINDA
jgi:hypothetical protein